MNFSIAVSLKKDPEMTGLVALCLPLALETGIAIKYGVYWDAASARQGGLMFHEASELEWGEPILPFSEAAEEYEDEDEANVADESDDGDDQEGTETDA